MRKILIHFFILLFGGIAGNAQTLSGTITDDKSNPLPYVNIALQRSSDKSLTASAVSGKDGKFSLSFTATGKFHLKLTSIGFAEKTTEDFEVGGADFSKDLGTIILTAEHKTLKEVDVISMRPQIVQKADRLVVGVEGTAMAAGSNAFSVLSKAPGVFIDPEGNIQLNGRGGITVMIDNRLTYLSPRDLRTMLEGMSAENIKNIEIITNPSSRHDAEGTSGILNINLKKNSMRGMNGSVYAGTTWNFYQVGYTYGGNLNFKNSRWNSFINLDGSRRVGGRNATFTRIFYGAGSTTYFDQDAVGNWNAEGPPIVRAGTDFTINDKHSVGIMGNFNTNTAHSEFLTDTKIGSTPNNPNSFINADNFSRNTYTGITSNLHYTGKLDTLGMLLTADIDFVKITNRGESHFYNYFTKASGSSTQDFLYTNTPNGYDIYSARIDYTYPVSKTAKLEVGAKASKVVSDNDSRFYFNNGSLVPDPLRTNHFKYTGNIYAGYVNWAGDLSKKWMLQAGLRIEQTVSLGKLITANKDTSRNYVNAFPSIFLQHKVSDNYGISYSYSRRLTRPNYGSLNPFRAYRDPYTWVEGNPALRPQYTNSFSIQQSIKKIYNLTLSYQHSVDVMAEIPILYVSDTTTVYTTGNVDRSNSYGFTATGPVKITKKWDTQNTIALSYNKFETASNNGDLENAQLFYMFQTNHTLLLPMKFRGELNFVYRGPAASGLYRMDPMHRFDIALKKSILKNKMEVAANVNDIFKGYRYLWTTNINGNKNEFNQYFRFRSVGLTLRYSFSKGLKVDQKRRDTNLEELNRT